MVLQGTNSRVIAVANKIPKASEIAIGTKNIDCVDVANIIGNKPKNVVSEVSMTALNRAVPAVTTASSKEPPFRLD